MEAGRSLLSPTPSPPPNLSKTQLKNPISSASAPVLHDQANKPTTSISTTSIVRHFPASVFVQEPQNDYRACLTKGEKVSQATLHRRHVDGGSLLCEEGEKQEFDQYLKHFERRLLYQPGLWCLSPATCTEEKTYLAMSTDSMASDANVIELEQNNSNSFKPVDVLALAKRAMIASKKAALLAEKSSILESEMGQSHSPSSDLEGSNQEVVIKGKRIIRSKRLLERQSKNRRVSEKLDNVFPEISRTMITDMHKKIEKGLNTDDPFRLFLWGPETRQLLTVKEENDLFLHIQELMKLEEVKWRLHMEFDREPTQAEWAEAVGVSCQVLQSHVNRGIRSRDKMIYANSRLVIHLAKQYEGKSLHIQDLLQEGSKGLIKSLEKFKPKAGCRFPTYAYWWIRQSIRKAIFQNSRTIRLPENVFGLLKKVYDARRSCSQVGHLPTNKELAKRVGIRVDKLESLLLTTRIPLSIQERAWADQDVTVQEITADPEIENPDLIVTKQMMRQHVHDLLGVLNRRERQIIEFRYGIHDNEGKSLSEIGAMYGLTKERVRQLESRAFSKLKGCLLSHGLETYVSLLV